MKPVYGWLKVFMGDKLDIKEVFLKLESEITRLLQSPFKQLFKFHYKQFSLSSMSTIDKKNKM